MTTTTHRPLTTSGALFPWRSLKTKVTIFTLAIFLIGIWSLAFYASYTLESDMEQALGEQQFSTVSILAADINDELDDRLKELEMIAAGITPAILGNAAATQKFLESHISFRRLFNFGGIVMRLDSIAIAEVPNHGRIGVNYSDRDFMLEALGGKTTLGKPVMGKKSLSPVFAYATPIRDTKGKVIGVVVGITDLSKPNFLTKITDNSYGKTGGYLLVSPKQRTIVYATDKKRIMEVLPAIGINPFIDRAIQGWEGSGIAHTPLGKEVLTSIKGIPVSGWYIAALMPTEEAFAPIRAMQQRMLLAAIFLTLLAGGLTWWILKRQLAPVFTTIKTLATLADSDHPPQPLPITRQDEIGELISGFNRLLEALGKRGEALKESEVSLARLNAQIQAKNKELEQVVYVASHDLRSPLVNIDGYGREVEYAIEELKKALATDYASHKALKAAVRSPVQEMSAALRYIRSSTTQMDGLLTGLLKLSRSGRAALTIVPLNMNDLISGVVAATEFQIKEAGVELHVGGLPPCRGDAVQVSQAFTNLLSNALKYLDAARPGVIRIRGVIEGERSIYSVEDNGIGIAPAHQENIFEVFHRLEPTKSEGEGLGLTIVRQVIGRLEGEVRVESKPGEGSRFIVALPTAKG